MFWAIIKPIYEELKQKGSEDKEARKKACYNSVEMRRNWSQEQIKEWNDKKLFVDCSGDTTLQTDWKNVSFITAQERKYEHGYYRVRAHFRLQGKEKVSYKIEEDKHTTAQHILAGLILSEENIQLQYRDIPFYLNEIELELKDRTADHFIEKSYIEDVIGINRRADLLFDLKVPNLTFGKGIVFEIVNSESMESIKAKAKDWARAGYSLVVIPIDNFDFKNYGLKEDNYLIMYQLFDDINVYLELMRKIKENEPLIDSFNDNVREMEKRMFFWRSGKHNYEFRDKENVEEIMLWCDDKDTINFKSGKSKLVLNCHDAGNKLIDVDIWENHELFHGLSISKLHNQLLKVTGAYFNEYKGKVSLVLSKFSTIKSINVKKENQDAKED